MQARKETMQNKTLPPLHGDGIHDDTAAIQARLDTQAPCVYLPPPAAHYLIRETLRIPSGQTLRLDPTTVIRLADGADCLMITNRDVESGNRDIALVGGIWDMNNPGQGGGRRTGLSMPNFGILMRFDNIENFTISGVTLRDPHSFGMLLARLKRFTVEDIVFDYQHLCCNNDGVHIEGGCRFGLVRNLRGTTTDDMVAINGDDFSQYTGLPIEDLTVDGVFTEHSAQCVRIMSGGSHVRNITVANVHGSFLWYAVTLSKFHRRRPQPGRFDNIVLRDFFCRKGPPLYNVRGFPAPDSERWSEFEHGKFNDGLVFIESGVEVGSLTIDGLHRTESCKTAPTLDIRRGAKVGSLTIRNARTNNETDQPVTFLLNSGDIGRLTLDNVDATSPAGGRLVDNSGVIRRLEAANMNPGSLRTDGYAALPPEIGLAHPERVADYVAGHAAFRAGDGAQFVADPGADGGAAYVLTGAAAGLVCDVRGDAGPIAPAAAGAGAAAAGRYAWLDLGLFDLFYGVGEILDPANDRRRNTGPLALRLATGNGAATPALELRLDAAGLDAMPADRYRVRVRARKTALADGREAVAVARVILEPLVQWQTAPVALSIAEGWQFKTDPDKRGEAEQWPERGADASWLPIDIVACGTGAWSHKSGWTAHHDYHGAAWYAVEFAMPEFPAGKPVWLVFHGVDGAAKVWLDGRLAGEQLNVGSMWFKPWALDISALAQPGKPARLVMRVAKDLFDAGIWKPVEIRVVEDASADNEQ
jgi:hypothetical protein